ncbi:MAG: hypothetical protein ACRC0X_09090, partial [Brevinema sp.]
MFAPVSHKVGGQEDNQHNDNSEVGQEENTEDFYNQQYINTKFNSFQLDNLKKGMYFLTQEDVSAIQKSPELFWQYIANNLPISQVLSIREATGKNKDEVYNKTVGDKIFIPSHIGLDMVNVAYKKGVVGTLASTYIDILKSIGLYANYLENTMIITELLISDLERTANEQATLVYNDAIKYPDETHKDAMYKQETGRLAREWVAENYSKEEIIKKLEKLVVNNKGFKHVSNKGNVCDIAAGIHRQTTHELFLESFITFQKNDLFLYDANSIPLGQGGEKNAYHTVFRFVSSLR